MRRIDSLMASALFVFATAAAAESTSPYAPRPQTWETILIGDSVARGAGDEHGMGISGYIDSLLSLRHIPSKTMNLGIDGADTDTVMALLEKPEVVASIEEAQAVVISIGGNDLFGPPGAKIRSLLLPQFSIITTIDDVYEIIDRLHEINPDASILLLGLYNPYRTGPLARFTAKSVEDWDGRLERRFHRSSRVKILRIDDLFDAEGRISAIDQFHPSSDGYEHIAQRVIDNMF